MSSAAGPLFTPYTLGADELANRFVMAPMTRNRAGADGVPGALMAEYYAQRAGAGLIIAEAATPAHDGRTYPNIAAIYNDEQRDGWRGVVDAIGAAGGRAWLQVQHGGRVGHPATNGLQPMAPSPVPLDKPIHTPEGKQEPAVPREMSTEDIERTVRAFADAARRAIEAGFGGVEVHAANGYLLHQFLAPNSNVRTDAYGGDAAARIRFVLEVADAVIAEVGAERVGVRISPSNPTNGIVESDEDAAELYPLLARELATRGITYLHVAFADPAAPLWAELRTIWPATLIGNPALPAELPADGGLAAAETLRAAGADLIALGRPFLVNPDLVERLATGATMNEARPGAYMYVGGPEGYSDYPVLSRR